MSHTPGPWAYDADSKEVFSSDEGHGCGWIASVDGNDSNGCPLPESMRLANARLIAAAPDLLLVCKCMAGDLQALLDGDDFSGMSDAEMFGVMLRSLNAAIAKAEGRGE